MGILKKARERRKLAQREKWINYLASSMKELKVMPKPKTPLRELNEFIEEVLSGKHDA